MNLVLWPLWLSGLVLIAAWAAAMQLVCRVNTGAQLLRRRYPPPWDEQVSAEPGPFVTVSFLGLTEAKYRGQTCGSTTQGRKTEKYWEEGPRWL